MRESELATLRLALTPGIGSRIFAGLMRYFGTAEAALAASVDEWEKEAQFAARLQRAALGPEVTEYVEVVQERCRKLEIEILTLGSAGYPELLAAIFDPPPVLYLRGRLPVGPEARVGIVGTRKASDHGLSFTYRLAGELSDAGLIVVSGLAMGIDAEAHRAVVDRGGTGIGVLAGGLDSIHPPVNRRLAESLCERGCLVSEHPPGTSPRKGYFVGRNRIIAGLSQALAVIEAGVGSGALLTAEFATDEGRSLFIMPGRPGDPRVAGSLPWLLDGANLLLSAADIMTELGLEAAALDSKPLDELGDDGTLFSPRGASFDAIMAASGLPASALLAKLSKLELAGRIRRGSDGFYYRLGE